MVEILHLWFLLHGWVEVEIPLGIRPPAILQCVSLFRVTKVVCFLLRWQWQWCFITPCFTFVFFVSFPSSFCVSFFFPSLILLPVLHLFFPVHTGYVCSVWLEICMRRSSAPLRTCSWMVRTLESCCSPGVAYASRDTSSSESEDKLGVRSSPDQSSLAVLGRTCFFKIYFSKNNINYPPCIIVSYDQP